jgi:hypothetical protein
VNLADAELGKWTAALGERVAGSRGVVLGAKVDVDGNVV